MYLTKSLLYFVLQKGDNYTICNGRVQFKPGASVDPAGDSRLRVRREATALRMVTDYLLFKGRLQLAPPIGSGSFP